MLEIIAVIVPCIAVVAIVAALARRSGLNVILGGGLGVLVAVLVVLVPVWKLMKSRSYELFGTGLFSVHTSEPLVALTFDDGPSDEFTQPVLDVLARHGVRATFFLIGAQVAESPAAARRIAAAGHEIGNHSWSHQRMIFRSTEWVRDEIQRTDAAIRATGYTGPIHFRTPYGKRFITVPRELSRQGRRNIIWDIEPETWPDVAGDSEAIAKHVIERARPGSIILLHVMYRSGGASRDAVPLIIRGLQERGFRFVTVSELMAAEEARDRASVESASDAVGQDS